MRIIFMGTPVFAVASLEMLLEKGNEVLAVVTSPDKPAGRGQKIHESAVKLCAVKHGLPVLQPEKLKDLDFLKTLQSFQADLFIVVAFRMLPEGVWEIPPMGTVNLHASLLPEYRGAAPINWAIINGETLTGTTVFFINHEIDKGNIISYHKEKIYLEDNAGTLHDRLMHNGAIHLVKTVQSIASGNFNTISQDKTSYQSLKSAPKIFRETCCIRWDQDVTHIHNLVRGLSPYPTAWTTLITPKGDRLILKIFETSIQPDPSVPTPGTIHTDNRTFLHVAAYGGWLCIRNLQLEGKKRMDIGDFLRGIPGIDSYRME